MPPAAILDIDGTLVDTNYHHAIAWYRAFRQHELIVPLWRIHHAIGMGSDMLVEHLVGKEKDEELGDSIRAAEGPLYLAFIEEAEPFEGARGLIEDLKQRGLEGHPRQLGQGQRARPLPRPARRARARRRLDERRRRRAEQARARPRQRRAREGRHRGRGHGRRHGLGHRGGQEGRHRDDRRADRRLRRRRARGAGAAVIFDSIQELRERIGETPLG
jgi:hypothetical protein